MATIRGTPQYLSPVLWHAHVEDGGQRHTSHNMFKSDVFSAGLIYMQFALMKDVTGFNQKNQANDGEALIRQACNELRERYSENLIGIIKLMLKFNESERPSWIELARQALPPNEDENEKKSNASKQ